MDKQKIESLLAPKFPTRHVRAALAHFGGMVEKFQAGDWESCTVKAGKFVEAVLKALLIHADQTPPSARKFSAGGAIDEMGRLPTGAADDAIRLAIPRACRFAYDIASNRGARHDAGDVDPNQMDANAIVPTCSWILAELIRYSQVGAVNVAQAQEIVDSLTARRYPLIEEVDGRVYFHHRRKTAPEVALMALSYAYPKRVNVQELIATIQRHGFRANNARVAVGRIRRFVDDDGHGALKLLATGRQRADRLLSGEG
jgi:hypothetical protein